MCIRDSTLAKEIHCFAALGLDLDLDAVAVDTDVDADSAKFRGVEADVDFATTLLGAIDHSASNLLDRLRSGVYLRLRGYLGRWAGGSGRCHHSCRARGLRLGRGRSGFLLLSVIHACLG